MSPSSQRLLSAFVPAAERVRRLALAVALVLFAAPTMGEGMAYGQPDAAIALHFVNGESTQHALPAGLDAAFGIEVSNTGGVALTHVRVADALVPACTLSIGDLGVGESVTYRCKDTGGMSGTVAHREFIERFEHVGFDNNDGIDSWLGSWQEIDPEGVGPEAGNIRIAKGGLWLMGSDKAESQASITRSVDLAEMEAATLQVTWQATRGGDGEVCLEIAKDGRNFSELDRFAPGSGDTAGVDSYDITKWISDRTSIRFRALAGNGPDPLDFELGSVEIAGQGWTGGEGFTNVAIASAEDGAGKRVTAYAESAIEFVVSDEDRYGLTVGSDR